MRFGTWFPLACGLFCSVWVWGCTGVIGEDGALPSGAPGSMGGSGAPSGRGQSGEAGAGDPIGQGGEPGASLDPSAGGLGSGPGLETPTGECSPGPVPPVRRLSRTEYLNTIQALFPGYTGTLDFPADAAMPKFDNEASLLHSNQLLVEAIADNADAVAAWAVKDLHGLTGCSPSSRAEEDGCARDFIESFGLRALRQPLSSDIVDDYLALFEEHRDSIDFEAGIQLTLSAMLQAPELLYGVRPAVLPAAARPPNATQFAAASRLAYALWQAPPDQALLDAAAAGNLDTTEALESELDSMVARALDRQEAALTNFHRQWLEVDRILEDNWNFKDTQLFPEWTDSMVTSVYDESLSFIDLVMNRRRGGLADLLSSRAAVLDANTADLYGVTLTPDGIVELPAVRAGIFSRAAFLASHGHQRNGSPPLRGIGIMERAFCLSPGQPPPTADTSNPADEADASQFTNRELFERRSANEPCNGCHSVINAFAYPLEVFDAVGRYRTEENGKTINTETELIATDIDGAYGNWQETAAAMAASDMVRECAAEHWGTFALGRPLQDDEACLVEDLADGIASGDSSLEIMRRAALYAAVAEMQ